MRLDEVNASPLHDTPGKATIAFADYLDYMGETMPPKALEHAKALGKSLIRQGFYFHGEFGENVFPRIWFIRDDIQVFLPSKKVLAAEMSKVRVYLGEGTSAVPVKTQKAASIDYSQLKRAHEKVLEAREHLREAEAVVRRMMA